MLSNNQSNQEYDTFCQYLKEKNISQKYIPYFWKLRRSIDYTVIVDNSGSTDSPLDPSLTTSMSIYQEMERLFNATFGITEKLDQNGVNLRFINRQNKTILVPNSPNKNGINIASDLFRQHDSHGNGGTPLAKTLNKVANELVNSSDYDKSKKQGIVIFTDGEDEDGMTNFQSCVQNIHDKYSNFHISVVVATLKQDVIDSYSKFDDTFRCSPDGSKRLDVTLCYKLENERCQRYSNTLSYEDYVAKILLGSVYREIGDMNDSSRQSGLSLIVFSLFVAICSFLGFCYFNDYQFKRDIDVTFGSFITDDTKVIFLTIAIALGMLSLYKFGTFILKGLFLGVVFCVAFYSAQLYLSFSKL